MEKNKTLLFLILLFAFVLTGCDLFNNDEEKAVDVQNLVQGEEMELTGMIYSYYEGDSSFSLKDGEQEFAVFIDNSLEGLTSGAFVKVEGIWSTTDIALLAEEVKILNEQERLEYFKKRYPVLEIEIVDYPNTVAHTCSTPKFKFELTNTGNETVTHRDLHHYYYDYGFYYFFDDDWHRANAERDDYDQVSEHELVGFLSNQGFKYFEDIQPGQTREVEYWAGGEVTKTAGGTAGSQNIFGNQSVGDVNVSFGWADKNNYDPIFFFRSEQVTVKLLSDQCDLGL